MSKNKTLYGCQQCGYDLLMWASKCLAVGYLYFFEVFNIKANKGMIDMILSPFKRMNRGTQLLEMVIR